MGGKYEFSNSYHLRRHFCADIAVNYERLSGCTTNQKRSAGRNEKS